ncbi:HIG1 domain family member 1A [Operophtera brumata]|uniref:HIG1 domain family member 1A n=1 Tax=Operophtera brumata TaxID=104452 RepID=A0A0L7KNI9_OPEBR|nr:HIG1 domain family member 1A [Operophtera brumata]
MSKTQPIFDYTDESHGIMGLMGVCGYGAYAYKKRGKMSTSVFLMQLRVAAQGTVVSALTIGLAYTLVKDHLLKDNKKD